MTDAEQRAQAAQPTPPEGPQSQVVHVQERGNGVAVAALVCGIAGISLGLLPILFFMAWALGIVAFVLGLIARRRARDPMIGRRKMATWGVILGMASFAIGWVGFAIVVSVLNEFAE